MHIKPNVQKAIDDGAENSLSVVFFLYALHIPQGPEPLAERRQMRDVAAKSRIMNLIADTEQETGETPVRSDVDSLKDTFTIEASPYFVKRVADRGQGFIALVEFNSRPQSP